MPGCAGTNEILEAARIKTATKQLAALVTETGSRLMQLNGVGPSGAARLLGDVSRFPTKAHSASWNGAVVSAPQPGMASRDAVSGQDDLVQDRIRRATVGDRAAISRLVPQARLNPSPIGVAQVTGPVSGRRVRTPLPGLAVSGARGQSSIAW